MTEICIVGWSRLDPTWFEDATTAWQRALEQAGLTTGCPKAAVLTQGQMGFVVTNHL